MNISWSSQISLWGFIYKFYQYISSSLSLIQIVFTNFIIVGTTLYRFLVYFSYIFIQWLYYSSLLFSVLYLYGFCFY